MATRRLRVFLTLSLGILITIGGCTEHPSIASRDADQQLQQVRLSAPGAGPSYSASGSGTVSQVIGAEGGTLSIPGGHQIVFPAGALAEPTTITARASKVFIEVEFGPHGAQFPAGAEPVLTLSYKNAVNVKDESSLKIAYVKGNKITEILSGTVDTQAKTVSAKLQHFSTYVLASG